MTVDTVSAPCCRCTSTPIITAADKVNHTILTSAAEQMECVNGETELLSSIRETAN